MSRSRMFDPSERQLYCLSPALSGKHLLIEDGDKIVLPPSYLETLARMNIEYPMLFEITIGPKKVHCGVLEFSSQEGFCFLPSWMIKFLNAKNGEMLTIRNVSLPKAKFVKFRPQSVDFLDAKSPRALLEFSLRKFTCLTIGEIITVKQDDKYFALEVCDLRPGNAVSIVETDCEVDFDEPVGYKEFLASKVASMPKEVKVDPIMPQKARTEESEPVKSVFVPFSGAAARIDGKASKNQTNIASENVVTGSVSEKVISSADSKKFTSSGRTLLESSSGKTNGVSGLSSSLAPATSSSQRELPINSTSQSTGYVPKIGEKYGRLKTSGAAFVGTARKLDNSS